MIFSEVKAKLDEDGIPYDRSVRVGAMIEVPSAALIADELARHVDFFSIGTNDLVQYTMAADRGNESVAHLYQPTNPAVLKLIRMTIKAAKNAGITVGVCGESAADPIVGVLWAAMGVDHLSMSPTYIPLISKILARLTREDLEEYARVPDNVPAGSTAQEIFDACHSWLATKIPNLDDILI
jgi:phosphotransferase system enzyme I (PtsI)